MSSLPSSDIVHRSRQNRTCARNMDSLQTAHLQGVLERFTAQSKVLLKPAMGVRHRIVETQLQKLRERLRQMSDEELIKFGKEARKLAEPRIIPVPDPWKAQLEEARGEWRRRHPKG